jgi:hypothetical protein
MSVGFQAQVDELLEIAPIQQGTGDVEFDAPNSERESQPDSQPQP